MAGGVEALGLVVVVALIMFAVMFVLRKFHTPHVISYIIVGVLIGPSFLNLVQKSDVLSALGDMGIVLLLFFIGMHVSLPKLVEGWRIAIIGTALQIAASVGIAFLLGFFLDWPFARSILLGFVISLSSTAVILKMLEEWDELQTRVGRDVISILLVQDVAIVLMLIALSFMTPEKPSTSEIVLPIIGGLLFITLLVHIFKKGRLRLLSPKYFKGDHELELVAALIICFGFAALSGLFHLSTALGAFIAGIVLAAARETKWVHDHLYPLQIIFVAFFFIYVGLLLDVAFILENIMVILGLVAGVLLTNTVLNAFILKALGRQWRNAFYGGALLSQIGEFSFLLAAVGLSLGVITNIGYQYALATISVGLLVTPFWIMGIRKLVCPNLSKARL